MLRRIPGIIKRVGTSAFCNTGTAAGNVVLLDSSSKLPAVDGSQLTNLTGQFVTGDGKLTFSTSAPSGWILCDDGSIGDGSSSATTRANADTSALFTLLYNNIAALVVQDSSGTPVARGASAAADFAAHRRLVIPKVLGRSIAISGAGSGLTSRTLGATAGAETETPTIAKTAAHTHTVAVPDTTGVSFNCNPTSTSGLFNETSGSTGSGTALNILDPSTYMNFMLKL